MGYSVSDNSIVMTRGDTAKILVTIKKKSSGEPYEPQPGDTIRFSAKKYTSDKSPVIVKDIPIDTQILTLNPEDTKNLNFGPYHFDVQLIFANGDVDTFIEDSILELRKEISE